MPPMGATGTSGIAKPRLWRNRYYTAEQLLINPHLKWGLLTYTEEDEKWVENAVCMRSAGVPVEMLIEYVKLFQQGDSTLQARRDLLAEARVEVQKNLDKYQATMDRLNYKISRYDEALKTGVLTWDAECINKSQGGKES